MSTRRKTSRGKRENQHQIQPMIRALMPGFEPGPHQLGASALSAAPPLLSWVFSLLVV